MSSWKKVCQLSDISPNTGVCALVNGQQVAIFRQAKSDAVYAIGNFDPIGRANVLSRGLMAQLGDSITVASPLYKQHYRLNRRSVFRTRTTFAYLCIRCASQTEPLKSANKTFPQLCK